MNTSDPKQTPFQEAIQRLSRELADKARSRSRDMLPADVQLDRIRRAIEKRQRKGAKATAEAERRK